MIAEQLQAARAAHWRQKQSPILTLDDAQSWLALHPLCLYLPRHAQLPAPAPSFVEACIGNRQATPGAAAIEPAQGLLTRLIASGAVVPLNLLGVVGEQPDFLAHRDALPFVLALRADPDWKHAPQKSSGHKVSPLVLELWKVLDKEGALTAAEARATLGRELTEAAVLRALCELWSALRISPVLADAGQPARWEMLRVRHRGALETGSTTSQVTALSLLVSMYLQSVYAASSEEIEIFLSPVASRSRVREAVRGLSATRQIHALSMDAQTYHFLENGLPEFSEPAASSAPAETGASHPSLAVQKPRPRKVQATARPLSPAASSAPPPPASAPIFRRSKTRPEPERRPESLPAPRPAAAQPAARAGWKSPARGGSQGQSAWKQGKPATRPPAGGGRWAQKEGGKPRPASGSRPPFVPGRPAARPYVAPNDVPPDARATARPDARGGQRPDTRGGARPSARGGARSNNRPGAWAGAGKRERPAPWALPARKSNSAARPPRAGGRGDAPFRPAQKEHDRPDTRPAQEGARPFPPRAPRGERERGDPSRARFAPGRPQGGAPLGGPRPPSAYGANRSPVPYRSSQARSGQARSGPPRGSRPAKFDTPKTDTLRADTPRLDRPKFDQARRPFPRASGSAGPRPPAPGGAGRGASPRSKNDRPRPAGYARPGGKPGPGENKSWPRAGGSAAKSGKPPASFRGRKPDRKKPGA